VRTAVAEASVSRMASRTLRLSLPWSPLKTVKEDSARVLMLE